VTYNESDSSEPGMVVHGYNPNTYEAETGG
jgi:hypothetical protein